MLTFAARPHSVLLVVLAACGGDPSIDRDDPSGGGGSGASGGGNATSTVAGPVAVSSAATTSTTSGGGEGGAGSGSGGGGGEAPAAARRHELLVNIPFVCDAQDGLVRCWGGNGSGRLGVGADEGIHPPTWLDLPEGVVHLSGQQPSYALLQDGTMWHWGLPTLPEPLPEPFLGLAAVADVSHTDATYAVLSDGSVLAWGPGDYGQLGLGDDTGREEPTIIEGLSDIVDVEAGYEHACARSADGDLTCWGRNHLGQVGDGTEDDRWNPTPVLAGVRDVSLGWSFACAVFDDAAVRCWGANDVSQLGEDTLAYLSLEPLVVGLPDGASQVATGLAHSCALLLSGHVHCWGADDSGQLGRGSVGGVDRPPAPVLGLDDAIEIAAAGETTCARRADGSVWCWGANLFGQLADGTTDDRGQPVRVPDGAVGD